MKIPLLLILLYIPLFHCVANPNCTSESPCSCDLKGAWMFDLTGFNSTLQNSYIEVVGSDANTYRFYPCGVDKPWGNGECQLTDTMCMQSMLNGSYYSLGKFSNFTVKEAIADGILSYVMFEYKGGSAVGRANRTSTVKVYCSRNEGLTYLNEDPALEFNLVFNSPMGCPIYSRELFDSIDRNIGLDL